MSFAFPQYVNIKDNYCCCYLGYNTEYIVQMNLLRRSIEKQLPGLKMFISCRDEFLYLLEGNDQIIPSSMIEAHKSNFAYIREITYKHLHPIQHLMEESDLKITPIQCLAPRKTGIVLIAPEGLMPTKSLTKNQLTVLLEKTSKQHPLVVGSDIHNVLDIKLRPSGKEKLNYLQEASLVIGVENEYTFLAPLMGATTQLIDTGVGKKLFQKMYPGSKVINF